MCFAWKCQPPFRQSNLSLHFSPLLIKTGTNSFCLNARNKNEDSLLQKFTTSTVQGFCVCKQLKFQNIMFYLEVNFHIFSQRLNKIVVNYYFILRIFIDGYEM